MRRVLSIILCAVLAFPWGAKVAITADFLIRRDYIAKNLCENRDKPELHCNGKCVLMQKLNLDEDKRDEPEPLPEISRIEISSFLFQELQNSFPVRMFQGDLFHISHSDRILPVNFIHDIFHPPQVIC